MREWTGVQPAFYGNQCTTQDMLLGSLWERGDGLQAGLYGFDQAFPNAPKVRGMAGVEVPRNMVSVSDGCAQLGLQLY